MGEFIMSLSVGTGDYSNYYNNNNNVTVPYRPGEEPKKEEIVIPFRSSDDVEPENEEVYTVSQHHGAGAEVSFDNANYGQVSIQPYTYNVEVNNGKGQNVKFSVGPEIIVSDLGSSVIDNSLDLHPYGGVTSSNVGAKVNFEAKKELETVDNTAIAGKIELGSGYTHMAPFGQKTGNISPAELNPTGNGAYYNLKAVVGVEYSIDDKNKIGVYADAGIKGYNANMEKGDPEDAGTVNIDGVPQYTKINSQQSVIKLGAEVDYTHKTKNGEFYIKAEEAAGIRTYENRNISTTPDILDKGYTGGNYFGITLGYRF